MYGYPNSDDEVFTIFLRIMNDTENMDMSESMDLLDQKIEAMDVLIQKMEAMSLNKVKATADDTTERNDLNETLETMKKEIEALEMMNEIAEAVIEEMVMDKVKDNFNKDSGEIHRYTMIIQIKQKTFVNYKIIKLIAAADQRTLTK